MMRRFNLTLLALIVLFGAPFYWLLLDNRPGDGPPKPIHIAQLRQLANSVAGAKPDRLQGEVAAFRSLPRDLFAAGAGLKHEPITVLSYRLLAPDGTSVVIDSGIAAGDAQAMDMDQTNPEGQARIERALREASLVLFTHEHPDHLGAALRMGGGIPPKARFNSEQLPPAELAAKLPWPLGALPAPDLLGKTPIAVAPGVVVIPAPLSHTPGSQMIYVRFADGREVLFTGDIATLRFSWQELRARSRLVSRFFGAENRDEVYAWLKTIRQLKREAPGLAVIPGHDISTLYPLDGKDPVAASPFRFELQHQPVLE